MDRPYIFCHMMMSLDGKIMGSYMNTPEGAAAGDVFYKQLTSCSFKNLLKYIILCSFFTLQLEVKFKSRKILSFF